MKRTISVEEMYLFWLCIMEIMNAMMILINEYTVEPAYNYITYNRFCAVVKKSYCSQYPFQRN